ncbi:MAG: matrixin family metalloprotease [Candidatus Latescibacteria bacterium]|nr:matrixin family metalloprotease [Candidatus Latescibacterota bacterium]
MSANRLPWSVVGSILLTLFLIADPVEGSYDVVSLEHLTQGSEVVVIGKVVAITSQENEVQTIFRGDGIEVVYVDLSVSEVLKGGGIQGHLTLKVLRGRDGIPMWPLDYFPTFTVGEEVLVFLKRSWDDAILTPTAGFQGKFTLQADIVVENGSSRTIFVNQVRELITKGLGSSIAARPLLPLSGCDWLGSSTLLTRSFFGGQFKGTKRYWVKATPPAVEVEFHYNSNGQPTTDAYDGTPLTTALIKEQIDLAFQAWNQVNGSYLTFKFAADTNECQVHNTTNVILWADLDVWDPGVTGTVRHHPGAFSGVIQGADIILDNSNRGWTRTGNGSSPGQTDIRAVVTHELGHVLGLGESSISANTMYNAIGTPQSDKWSLEWGDKSGAVWQATDDPTGALPFSTAWSALPNIALVGDVTVPSNLTLETRATFPGLSTTLTINLNGSSAYISSSSNGIFADTGATWNPKDVAIKSGTTLKGHTPTIQRALDLASTNDYSPVEVGSGTYNEGLTMKTGVNVFKKSGVSQPTVNNTGGDNGALFYNVSSITVDSINFTGRLYGVNIQASNGITINHATLSQTQGNFACAYVLNTGTSVTLQNCTLDGNSYGLSVSNAAPVVRHSKLIGNTRGVYGDNNAQPDLDYDESPGQPDNNSEDNQIYSNSPYDAYFTNALTIDAENIWWGESPLTASEIVHTGPGTIDYNPYRSGPFSKPVVVEELPTDPRRQAARRLDEEG